MNIYSSFQYPEYCEFTSTGEDEFEIFRQYCIYPTSELRNRIVMQNIRLVYKIASLYRNCQIDENELQQEGVFGLIDAVESFDYTRNIRFSTYAFYRIHQVIRRYVDNNLTTVRLPVRLLNDYRRIQKVTETYQKENNALPSSRYLSEELGLSQRRIDEIINAYSNRQSLSLDDSVCNAFENSMPVKSILMDRNTSSEIENIENQIDRELMLHQLRKLTSETEYYILMMRYGFTDSETHTLKNIGDRLNMTPNQVRRIEQRTLKRLSTSRELRKYL